ncbi:cyclin-like protein [Phlebopus sp. FC_14]|nr:cyclin-like protein [Phlebopus sp. FC_14]
MGAPAHEIPVSSQWIFPVDALQCTPSVATSSCSIPRELYDRARGVEFLFRLGSSLGLPSSAMFTAATWFHRFFMRFSMEDYHRQQDVAAACIFLATKTEECGRKLRDVARVCQSKITGADVSHIPGESVAIEQQQVAILLAEGVLLEALCFDFVTTSPHAILVDLFDAEQTTVRVQDCAWSIAHDSYRTPLCILFSPSVIAAACFVLAQRATDGPHSPSLDARISASPPSASLPTPPSHKPASPDASRFAVEYFGFSETDLRHVADALSIILEFYAAQDAHINAYVAPLASIPPPTHSQRFKFYEAFSQILAPIVNLTNDSSLTPDSSYSNTSPAMTPSHAGAKADATMSEVPKKSLPRLDLS